MNEKKNEVLMAMRLSAITLLSMGGVFYFISPELKISLLLNSIAAVLLLIIDIVRSDNNFKN